LLETAISVTINHTVNGLHDANFEDNHSQKEKRFRDPYYLRDEGDEILKSTTNLSQ